MIQSCFQQAFRNHLLAVGLGIFCLGSLFFPLSLSAQDPQGFSLEESIQYALKNSKQVQNARFDQYIAKAQVNEILANGFPQIKGSADLQYFVQLPTQILPGSFNPKTDPATGQTIIDPETGQPVPGDPLEVQFGFPWQSTVGIEANQLIADATFFIGLKAAKVYEDIARKSKDRTEEETALTVSKAYYQVLIAEEQAGLLAANLARVQKLFDETSILNEEGFAEKIDVDRLRISLNNLLIEQEKVARFTDMSRNLLKFQMGLPLETQIELTESVDLQKEVPPLPLKVNFDPRVRPEYQLLQAQMDLENYNTQRLRAALYPSLYAFGAYQFNAQRDEFNFFDTDQSWFPISVVGLQLNVPIFDGLRARAQVQQSKLTKKKLENDMAYTESSIQLELRNTDASLQNAFQSLSAYQANVQLAQRVYEVSRIKYKEGVGSSLEVNDAETQLKESESNYLNGLFEYLMARVEWQKARGEFARYRSVE
jgi:outer membrane protein TolC